MTSFMAPSPLGVPLFLQVNNFESFEKTNYSLIQSIVTGVKQSVPPAYLM